VPSPGPRVAASAGPSFGDRIARLVGQAAAQANGQASDGHGNPGRARDRAEDQPAHQRGASAPAQEEQSCLPDGAAAVRHEDWAQPATASWNGPDERPLLDASILVAAVWRWRRLIGVTTILGALLGVVIALATPHKYYAESRLFVDPREVRVTEDDVRNQQLSTEAILAIIDSQLQILSSTSVLDEVIADLGLAQDPEFNGSLSAGGLSGGIGVIREILTGRDPASDAEQKALDKLRDALHVSRNAMTFVIIVGVETRDPEKSALIANKIVDTYLDSEGAAQSGLLERTSEAIDIRINALRSDLDEAEREVERFKAENGIVGVGGQSIDDKEIIAISDQLANARAIKVGVRVKAQNLAKADPEDVLSGSFPEEFLSANLVDLRKQYSQTKSAADALATRLGPRHPQYVSAKQSLETIRAEITRELRRIVASSQSELQRAVETEQELASQMAVAKSRAMDQSVEFVTLRELERKATATREIYESFLRRSRETSERSNLSTRNVRVISPAEAPLETMGPSRKIIAALGMAGGFLAGLCLALLAGALQSIRAFGTAGRAPDAPPRSPNLPNPGPGTPPQGLNRNARPGAGPGSAGLPVPGAQDGDVGYAASRAEAGRQDAMHRAMVPEPLHVGVHPAAYTGPQPQVHTQPGFEQPRVQPVVHPPVQPLAHQHWPAPQPAGINPGYPQPPYQPPHLQALAFPQYAAPPQTADFPSGFMPAGMVPQQPGPPPVYPGQPSHGYPAAAYAAAPYPGPANWPGSAPVMPHQPVALPQPVPAANVQGQEQGSAQARDPAQARLSTRAPNRGGHHDQAPAGAAARDLDLDRIRRQMDRLRSRIGGHSAGRRRA
jgi:succinoglycan biosynthesis transport protein ExoP